MEEEGVLAQLRTLNESELFYRNYRLAKFSSSGFEAFVKQIDPEHVRRLDLLVPEWPDTIRSEYLENQFFSPDQRVGIHVRCIISPMGTPPDALDFVWQLYSIRLGVPFQLCEKYFTLSNQKVPLLSQWKHIQCSL